MRRRYNNTEQEQEAIAQEQDFLGDIGNFELPDIDLDLMEFLPSDDGGENEVHSAKGCADEGRLRAL